MKMQLKALKKQLSSSTKLCVVSKNRSEEEILSYYEVGERIFGERHAQELIQKANDLPKDIQWHFIGHLQRNKVKSVLPIVSCVQSLDSIELAKAIEKEATKINKVVDCYVEAHLATEDDNKYGLLKEEVLPFVEECSSFEHISISGLMVMGPNTENEERIKEVFLEAKELFDTLKEKYPTIQTLSMGMSDDYKIALDCGSNLVRIGSYLF